MKKTTKIYLTAALITAAVSLSAFNNDKYYKLYQHFEILTEVFKTITNYYVLDIDPEVLANSSIEGMLETLDPYSVYYEENDSEDLDLINFNRYVGFGISINQVDSINTVIEVREGFGAWQAGLKPGDKLFHIDGTEVLKIDSDELRNYTNGEPNSIAEVTIIRASDTLDFQVKRETVKLKDVVYYDILDENIGYIYLEGFSKNAPREVRAAINDMTSINDINGLILDLRGNPGGLLYSAIAISEFFVPKGSMIVYTKGRDTESINSHYSTTEPLMPDIPLAVMINGGSASASEIVAGCIQDLDRGIVVGRTSFGKGLVQSVFSLNYNTRMKLTTAKYYTPSGRCIQRLEFGEKYNVEDATNEPKVFYTQKGREVTESQGIVPDSIINNSEIPEYVEDIANNYYIFKYANNYFYENESINPVDTISDNLINDFQEYLISSNYNISSELVLKVENIKNDASNYNLSKNIIQKIEELEETIIREKININSEDIDFIVKLIQSEILSRYLSEKDYYAFNVRNNPSIRKTIGILKDKNEYETILTTSEKDIDNKN